MPMRQKDCSNSTLFAGEDGGEGGAPGGKTLGCVDENAVGAGADEVGICSWNRGDG